jgi:arabinose-5-phosphate isomerase
VVLALSKSGESSEVVRLLPHLAHHGAVVVALCGDPDSALAQAAAVTLRCETDVEPGPYGILPTASTTAMLVLGDALAACVMLRKAMTPADVAAVHPAGVVGARAREWTDG